jgi:hypothetical protein
MCIGSSPPPDALEPQGLLRDAILNFIGNCPSLHLQQICSKTSPESCNGYPSIDQRSQAFGVGRGRSAVLSVGALSPSSVGMCNTNMSILRLSETAKPGCEANPTADGRKPSP